MLGVPLTFDWSLLVTFAVVIYLSGASGVLLYAALLLSVLLHEYGHIFMARRFGYPTREVGIFAFGGLATIDFGGSTDLETLFIALAGPGVSLLLAAVTLPALLVSPEYGRSVLGFGFINLIIAVFNMIPIYPFDGGRCFKALLGMGWGPRVARSGTLVMSAATTIALVTLMIHQHNWSGAVVVSFFAVMGLSSLWSGKGA